MNVVYLLIVLGNGMNMPPVVVDTFPTLESCQSAGLELNDARISRKFYCLKKPVATR